MKEYPIYTVITPDGGILFRTTSMDPEVCKRIMVGEFSSSWEDIEKQGYTIASGCLQLNTERVPKRRSMGCSGTLDCCCKSCCERG